MSIRLDDDKVLFFAKMGVMLSNGIPLLNALRNLHEEAYSEELKEALRTAIEQFEGVPKEQRWTLPETGAFGQFLGQTGSVFEGDMVSLIRSGERAGCLDLVARMIPEYILFRNLETWKST